MRVAIAAHNKLFMTPRNREAIQARADYGTGSDAAGREVDLGGAARSTKPSYEAPKSRLFETASVKLQRCRRDLVLTLRGATAYSPKKISEVFHDQRIQPTQVSFTSRRWDKRGVGVHPLAADDFRGKPRATGGAIDRGLQI